MVGKQEPNEALIRAFGEALQRHLGDDFTKFGKEEATALSELARLEISAPGAIAAWVRFYAAMRTLGALGLSFQKIVKWFLWAAATYALYKAWVVGWIMQVVQNGGKP